MILIKDKWYNNNKQIGFIYQLKSNKQLGYLHIVINNIEHSSIITDFYCLETKKGYGTQLLNYAIKHLKKINIKYIYLDDMTIEYRKTHNIYKKFGFNYINNFGPEMILIL
jgi:hypothetical protein